MKGIFASITNPALPAPLSAPGQGDTFSILFASLWGAAIVAAGLAFLVFLIVGGLQWITAGGDKAQLENARDKITNGLIGLVIVVSTYIIISLIQTVFGVNILKPSFPTPV